MALDQKIAGKAKEYVERETAVSFRNEVEELLRTENEKELADRFFKDLEFGTGGMRGEIGGGYNRMNPYTIQRATQGLANYINMAGGVSPKMAIAYDSRNFSEVFALETALVCCGNGIETYLFSELRPTPELSFAVRHLKATSGVVITASHNPKEYNGYKVYWSDGGQIVSPHDKAIIQEVNRVGSIQRITKEEALARGLLHMIDKDVDDAYIAAVKAAAIRPELIRERGSTLKVVYTPLHGTGGYPVSRALGEMGIEVIFVPEQREPDGNFPTAPFPNPEETPAMKMGVELGRKLKADLIMGTDPDSDRLGIAVPDGDAYVLVTGNQLGSLLIDYVLSSRKETGKMPARPLVIKTIVTTELQRRIAAEYGAECIDTLTGFKFIGAKIHEFEGVAGAPQFVVGGEESYGYLVHTAVRDKDAVSAATMTAEMTLHHVSQGKSLMDRLREIWARHGYYEEILISKYFKGPEGVDIMKLMMERLRKTPPPEFAGQAVKEFKDYLAGKVVEPKTGKQLFEIGLPRSNVLQFVLESGDIVTARPSGTEPKIKFYASCHSEPGMEFAQAKAEVGESIKRIEEKIGRLIDHTMDRSPGRAQL